ncbi:MAG: UDP-N-acetylglucosamine 1-carboxyvinyltransferase [candidate division WOR-3 bacterium]
MEIKYLIKGGKKLKGEIEIEGAKNAALPILASTILLNEKVILENIPDVEDVNTMLSLLETLGARIKKIDENRFEVDPEGINSWEAPYEAVRKMRASIYVLGPLLARFGKAKVAFPGGCSFGPRPINYHLEGLAKMGAEIEIDKGFIIAKCKKLKGEELYFDQKSVGATAHLAMASIFAKGKTVILNASKEPEVVDLLNFLKKCGAKIKGEGEDIVEIEGVKKLSPPLKYKIIDDRIEAGTFLVAARMTKGEIKIKSKCGKYLENVIEKLKESGAEIEVQKESIYLNGKNDILPLKIETAPYPGFPTDLQPQFVSMLSIAKGTSIINEGIYPERFGYTGELMRMGANIKVEKGICIIEGIKKLKGTHLIAPDIRAGAALVIAALSAEGESIVEGIEHIKRGYKNFHEKLKKLGANINLINVSRETLSNF